MATLGEMLGLGAVPPQEEQYPFAPSNLPMQQPPQAAPFAAPPDVGTSLEDGLADLTQQADLEKQADELAALRRAQAASLSQHAQFAQGIQQRQSQVDLQSADLALAERMSKIFAPDTPSAARDILLNREARSLGVDPKGESFRELKQMIRGLEKNPDNLAALRSSFIHGGIETPPGQLTEMTRAAFSGNADPLEFLDLIRSAQPAPVSIQRPDGMMRLGGEPPAEVAQAAPAQAAQATTLPGEMTPEMARRMGYGTQPRTNREAQELGYRGPTDPAAQRKELETRRPVESAQFSLIDRFVDIDTWGYGRYDVSSWRDINVTNLSQAQRAIVDLLRSAGTSIQGNARDATRHIAEHTQWGILPNSRRILESDPTSRDLFISRRAADQTANEVMGERPPANATAEQRRTYAEDRATITDQIQGRFAGMRFDLANALGAVRPSGLSKEEGADILRRVTTADTVARRELFRDVSNELLTAQSSFLGGPAYDLTGRPAERLQQYVASPFLPQSFKDLAQAEIDRRSAAPAQQPATAPGQRTEVVPPAGTVVTPPTATATADGVPVRPVQTETVRPPAPTQTEGERLRAEGARRDAAAQRDVAVGQETRRLQLEAIPEQRRLARQHGAVELANLQLRVDEAKERGNEREYRRARDAKADAEKQQARIQAAFSQLARALGSRSAGSGGIISSAGGDGGDPNAFKIGVIARRPPPGIRISPPPKVELPSLFRK